MDQTARKFLRAARQRLAAAQLLIDARFNLDALYLSGYAIECSMKAILIHRTPKSRRGNLLQSELFHSARGHHLQYLRGKLGAMGCPMPVEIHHQFLRSSSWSTDLRYETGLVVYSEARAALNAAKIVVDWVERSL